MNIVKIIFILLLLVSNSALSGELVKDAEIVRIGTSSDGVTDNIYIVVSGGTGPCANQAIIFPASASPSDGFFNRLYSTAILAYTTGAKKVRIFNPSNNNCDSATYIDLIK